MSVEYPTRGRLARAFALASLLAAFAPLGLLPLGFWQAAGIGPPVGLGLAILALARRDLELRPLAGACVAMHLAWIGLGMWFLCAMVMSDR